MKYRLSANPKFLATLSIALLNAAGTVDQFDCDIVFNRLSVDQIDTAKAGGDVGFMKAAICSWNGIADGDDTTGPDGTVTPAPDLPFTPENLDALLADAAFVRAAVRAFFANIQGAEVKN